MYVHPFMKAGVKLCISSTARFGDKLRSHPGFQRQKNNNKADSFFQLNFNVYIDVDNKERARAKDKKQIIKRRPIQIRWKNDVKIYSSGEKMGSASGH